MAHHLELSECRQRYIEECAEEIFLKLSEYGIDHNTKPTTTLEELLTEIHLKVRRIQHYAKETGGAIIAYSENRKHRRRVKRIRYKRNRNLIKKFAKLNLSYDQQIYNARPLPNYFSK